MLELLKEKVFRSNIKLTNYNLVILTWGNVSEIDRDTGLIVIKPSGIAYDEMQAEDMVVIDLNGNTIEGKHRPSSDTATHIELYKAFSDINSIVHTHSTYATAYAQAGISIQPYGTTHADYFNGDIPCTRAMHPSEIKTNYEQNTGKVIIETFDGLIPSSIPGCLVRNHGAFTWGKDCIKAVENAKVLEECAKIAFMSNTINPKLERIEKTLLEKHYNRKHGKHATYGQENM